MRHLKSGYALRWRHNGLDGVSNHQPHHCLLSRIFGHRSKKTSKPRVTGLCARNSPGTGEFSAQMASNAENVSYTSTVYWWKIRRNLFWTSICIWAILPLTDIYSKVCLRWNREVILMVDADAITSEQHITRLCLGKMSMTILVEYNMILPPLPPRVHIWNFAAKNYHISSSINRFHILRGFSHKT